MLPQSFAVVQASPLFGPPMHTSLGSRSSHSSSSGVPGISSLPLVSRKPSPQSTNTSRAYSFLQTLEQPSFSTVFPSSHSSLSAVVRGLQSKPASSTIPFPHLISMQRFVHPLAQAFVVQLRTGGRDSFVH